MSSLDSAVLASASLFSHNIWHVIVRPSASQSELMWVHRTAILAIGSIATVIAIFVTSIYGMFILAADLVFVLMLPQLTAVIFISWTNTYGALLGYIVGIVLRFGAGEPYISLKPFIFYPFYTNHEGQLFPFRTFAMLWSFATILLISRFTNFIFQDMLLSNKFDFLKCFQENLSINAQPNLDVDQQRYCAVSVMNPDGTETLANTTLGQNVTDTHEMKHLSNPIANGACASTVL